MARIVNNQNNVISEIMRCQKYWLLITLLSIFGAIGGYGFSFYKPEYQGVLNVSLAMAPKIVFENGRILYISEPAEDYSDFAFRFLVATSNDGIDKCDSIRMQDIKVTPTESKRYATILVKGAESKVISECLDDLFLLAKNLNNSKLFELYDQRKNLYLGGAAVEKLRPAEYHFLTNSNQYISFKTVDGVKVHIQLLQKNRKMYAIFGMLIGVILSILIIKFREYRAEFFL